MKHRDSLKKTLSCLECCIDTSPPRLRGLQWFSLVTFIGKYILRQCFNYIFTLWLHMLWHSSGLVHPTSLNSFYLKKKTRLVVFINPCFWSIYFIHFLFFHSVALFSLRSNRIFIFQCLNICSGGVKNVWRLCLILFVCVYSHALTIQKCIRQCYYLSWVKIGRDESRVGGLGTILQP